MRSVNRGAEAGESPAAKRVVAHEQDGGAARLAAGGARERIDDLGERSRVIDGANAVAQSLASGEIGGLQIGARGGNRRVGCRPRGVGRTARRLVGCAARFVGRAIALGARGLGQFVHD